MSLAKLTSISTKTLSLLLERQRMQTLPSFNSSPSSPLQDSGSTTTSSGNSLHLPQIKKNLDQLRNGIEAMREKEGESEAVGLLSNQYERMRGMLGSDAGSVPRSVASIDPKRWVVTNEPRIAYDRVHHQTQYLLRLLQLYRGPHYPPLDSRGAGASPNKLPSYWAHPRPHISAKHLAAGSLRRTKTTHHHIPLLLTLPRPHLTTFRRPITTATLMELPHHQRQKTKTRTTSSNPNDT